MLLDVPVLVLAEVSEEVFALVSDDEDVSPLVSEEDESVGLSQEESKNTPKVRIMNALLKGLKVCMLLIIAKRFQKQNNIYIISCLEVKN